MTIQHFSAQNPKVLISFCHEQQCDYIYFARNGKVFTIEKKQILEDKVEVIYNQARNWFSSETALDGQKRFTIIIEGWKGKEIIADGVWSVLIGPTKDN